MPGNPQLTRLEIQGFKSIGPGKQAMVMIATQSTRLVDEFEPGQIVIAERDDKRRGTVFRRLGEDAPGEWLERYSLSELWEKNVLGGRP